MFNLNDRVIYARGAKRPLINKIDIITKLYNECGYLFATMLFDYNNMSYPCWINNLDLISEMVNQ
jgi:hypothetical protein